MTGVQTCALPISITSEYNNEKRTEWIKCTSFGKVAEIIKSTGKEGVPVIVFGSIKNRSWINNDGAKQYITDINVHRFSVGVLPKDNEGSYSADPVPDNTSEDKSYEEDNDLPF